ncbi:uncharacterized protein [Ambystoma mexicanum]|uniref:uncharacterized protein n=1 Tax=Ambystoma mexicanum TaxID=8296 RepID=UPI0037E7EA84
MDTSSLTLRNGKRIKDSIKKRLANTPSKPKMELSHSLEEAMPHAIPKQPQAIPVSTANMLLAPYHLSDTYSEPCSSVLTSKITTESLFSLKTANEQDHKSDILPTMPDKISIPIFDTSLLAPGIIAALERRISLSLGPSTPAAESRGLREQVHFHATPSTLSLICNPPITLSKSNLSLFAPGNSGSSPTSDSTSPKKLHLDDPLNLESSNKLFPQTSPSQSFISHQQLSPIPQAENSSQVLEQELHSFPVLTRILNLLDKGHDLTHLHLKDIKDSITNNSIQLAKIEGFMLAQEACRSSHSACAERNAQLIMENLHSSMPTITHASQSTQTLDATFLLRGSPTSFANAVTPPSTSILPDGTMPQIDPLNVLHLQHERILQIEQLLFNSQLFSADLFQTDTLKPSNTIPETLLHSPSALTNIIEEEEDRESSEVNESSSNFYHSSRRMKRSYLRALKRRNKSKLNKASTINPCKPTIPPQTLDDISITSQVQINASSLDNEDLQFNASQLNEESLCALQLPSTQNSQKGGKKKGACSPSRTSMAEPTTCSKTGLLIVPSTDGRVTGTSMVQANMNSFFPSVKNKTTTNCTNVINPLQTGNSFPTSQSLTAQAQIHHTSPVSNAQIKNNPTLQNSVYSVPTLTKAVHIQSPAKVTLKPLSASSLESFAPPVIPVVTLGHSQMIHGSPCLESQVPLALSSSTSSTDDKEFFSFNDIPEDMQTLIGWSSNPQINGLVPINRSFLMNSLYKIPALRNLISLDVVWIKLPLINNNRMLCKVMSPIIAKVIWEHNLDLSFLGLTLHAFSSLERAMQFLEFEPPLPPKIKSVGDNALAPLLENEKILANIALLTSALNGLLGILPLMPAVDSRGTPNSNSTSTTKS